MVGSISSTTDLTALVIGWRDGKWRVLPTFWLPIEGLRDKAAADRVPYDEWHARGFLQATPGKTVSYEFVAGHLRNFSSDTIFKSLPSIGGTSSI